MELKVVHWFFAKNGKPHGPLDRSSIKSEIDNGAVGPDTLVWCKGMSGWTKAEDTELNTLLFGTPPPLPENPSVTSTVEDVKAADATLGIPHVEPEPQPPRVSDHDYKDRRFWLIFFGIVEMLIGVSLSIWMAMMTVVAFFHPGAPNQRAIGFSFLVGLTFSVALVLLGFGSIRSKRWARALLLIAGWFGLVSGLFSLVILTPIMNSIEKEIGATGVVFPPGVFSAIIVSLLVVYTLVSVGAVIFYGSRNVKITCENRDRVVRWTDRCPLPVLAICFLMVIPERGFPMPSEPNAFPMFGSIIGGSWALLLNWVFWGFSIWSALNFYRLSRRAWLLYTATSAALCLSTATTILVDARAYWLAGGMSEENFQQLPPIFASLLIWVTVGTPLLLVGYLLWLRKFFVEKERGPAKQVRF